MGRAPPGGLRGRGLGLGECPLLGGTVETTVEKGGMERMEHRAANSLRLLPSEVGLFPTPGVRAGLATRSTR